MKEAILNEYGIKICENGDAYNMKGKKLASYCDRIGYMKLSLTLPCGKRKTVSVHRMLALAFIPNPENKSDVNHRDGDKKNNSIENLEWLTHQENIFHAMKTGLMNQTGRPEKSERDEQIRSLHKEGKSIKSLAKMFMVSDGRIRQIINKANMNAKYQKSKNILRRTT